MSKHINVKNGIRYEMNGWTYISIEGEPKERGLAYGKLMEKDMKEVRRILDYVIYSDYGVKWEIFINAAKKYFTPKIKDGFPEFYEEMVGFAEGANMTIDEVVAWNNYFTLTEGWWSNMSEEDAISIKGSSNSKAGSSKEGAV